LVAAAGDGDKQAFAALLERHSAMLGGTCRRMLGDSGLAEDAAQEAAIQALLNLEKLEQPDRFGAWLTGIGLNVCRRWLRTQRVESEALANPAISEALERSSAATDPAEVVQASMLSALVMSAVGALPKGQREAVVLFYIQGLTQREVAEFLEIDQGAVKTRLHKARSTLRQRLAHVMEVGEMPTRETSEDLVEMSVADVRLVHHADGERLHAVILSEAGGSRVLPIWVGEAEATAIAVQLEKVGPPRPLTSRFMADLVKASGATLREVRIGRLADAIFYAEAVVDSSTGETRIDARPSDAVNLALALDAPIRVASVVLQQAEADARRGSADTAPVTRSSGAAEIVAEAMVKYARFNQPDALE
jgi:RNA polymerase sigma factor (sigma-70 family)